MTEDKKKYSKEITARFLKEMDRILADRSAGKVTADKFGEVVGISSSNLSRLRLLPDQHFVTVEAIGRLCHHYKVSPAVLITGEVPGSNHSLEQRVAVLEKQMQEITSKRLNTKKQ